VLVVQRGMFMGVPHYWHVVAPYLTRMSSTK